MLELQNQSPTCLRRWHYMRIGPYTYSSRQARARWRSPDDLLREKRVESTTAGDLAQSCCVIILFMNHCFAFKITSVYTSCTSISRLSSLAEMSSFST